MVIIISAAIYLFAIYVLLKMAELQQEKTKIVK